MFLKKRIPLEAYCEGMLRHVFSPHYDEVADALLGECPAGYREGINSKEYLEHFRAAVIQLLGVVFSRKLKRDQRSDALLYVGSFLREHGHEGVGSLGRQYSSAFGSDPEDGVREMASLFAQECAVPGIDIGKIRAVHYEAFYEVLRAFFDNIKSVKVV